MKSHGLLFSSSFLCLPFPKRRFPSFCTGYPLELLFHILFTWQILPSHWACMQTPLPLWSLPWPSHRSHPLPVTPFPCSHAAPNSVWSQMHCHYLLICVFTSEGPGQGGGLIDLIRASSQGRPPGNEARRMSRILIKRGQHRANPAISVPIHVRHSWKDVVMEKGKPPPVKTIQPPLFHSMTWTQEVNENDTWCFAYDIHAFFVFHLWLQCSLFPSFLHLTLLTRCLLNILHDARPYED